MSAPKVTLRKRLLPSGKVTLYLDFYPAVRNPKTLKLSRREYLGIYLIKSHRTIQDREENAKKLGGVQVIIKAKAGNAGKLFGAVTSQEISDALKAQFDIDIEKNKIVQAEPIKTFGSFSVKAKLGYEVSGTINVLVVEG